MRISSDKTAGVVPPAQVIAELIVKLGVACVYIYISTVTHAVAVVVTIAVMASRLPLSVLV